MDKNEIKYGNIYKMLVSFLVDMKQDIPIVFDRYTNIDTDYEIYGWINRKDGKRDFVLFSMYVVDDELQGTFVTSSAKYSKSIYEKMYGKEDNGHNECHSIDELINMAGI